MEVYTDPTGSKNVAFDSPRAVYTVGTPGAVQLTSQPPQQPPPPPSYPPPAYQPPPNAYDYNPSIASASAQYGAPAGYGVASTSYGYPTSPAAPQPQLQNNQNVQVNAVNATAAPVGGAVQPSIIAQPAPVVMAPPSYLGWSIFNCLCCFWPLGLAAIIYSVKVGRARNHEEAKSYSFTARNLNIAATSIAPILIIVVVGAVVGVGARTSSSASSSLYSPSNYYTSAYYYSYGYYYYYTYLMYYTYNGSYSSMVYTYSVLTGRYWYIVYEYGTLGASKYVSDYYFQYVQGAYYYYYYYYG